MCMGLKKITVREPSKEKGAKRKKRRAGSCIVCHIFKGELWKGSSWVNTTEMIKL